MKKITTLILSLVFAVSIIASASAKTLKIQMTFPKTSYDAQIVGMWTEKESLALLVVHCNLNF